LNLQRNGKSPQNPEGINYCPAADSFCAGGFAGTGRATAGRDAAFFRRK
jgi:hypothetical protein